MRERMVGLIPAAGRGTRLNLPYPKELYPIIRDNRYKPLAQYVVENLIISGIKDIIFVINETKHQLIGYFGNGKRFGCNFTYVVQETGADINGSTSPGLAHALDSAYHLTRGRQVFFGMADTIMEPENVFRFMMDVAQPQDQVLLGLFKAARPEKVGMVEMDGSARVRQIVDKPKLTDLTHAWGCIGWQPDFTEHLHTAVNDERCSDFAQIMNNAISAGMSFRGVVFPDGKYADLGTYEEIVELEQTQSIHF